MGFDRQRIKAIAAASLSVLGIGHTLLALQKRAQGGRFIRMVNYHGTLSGHADNFARQLAFYRRHFCPVRLDDLDGLIVRGRWPHERPGLIISFDDGLRTNYDVAAPLLEQFGFVGWFFIPTGFIDTPASQQAAFADARSIDQRRGDQADGRIAMSWEELRDLNRRHVVGCHTHTHWRMAAGTSEAELDREIVRSKRLLEERLGHEVSGFCWVGGEEHTYSAAAAACIRRAGFRYAFGTCSAPVAAGTDPFQLHRTHVESEWPLALVRFQIGGIVDRVNAAKRARVARVVSAGIARNEKT